MNYVITGGAGNTSKPIAEKLLAAGHRVTVIGRNQAHLAELTEKGAIAAIGSVEDVAFLKKTFAGADAVYTMVPPNFAATSLKDYNEQIVKNYVEAIRTSPIKYVVNLSSVGAHLSQGTGPVVGLHRGENALNALTDVNILHLRPSYFYQNLLSNVTLAKNAGIIGANFSLPGGKFPLVDQKDIAEVAAAALLKLEFRGHTILYIAGDVTGTDEIAAELGKAIGKKDLPWVKFTDEQALEGMVQAGLPLDIAKNYVEMGQSMDSGKMFEDLLQQPKPVNGKVKLVDFAKVFANAFSRDNS